MTRLQARRCALVFACGTSLAFAACESVPDLVFPNDATIAEDAHIDAPSITDGGGGDAGAGDAVATLQCPAIPPPGAICCDASACVGDHCGIGQNCATCGLLCPDTYCCAQAGKPLGCVDAAAACK